MRGTKGLQLWSVLSFLPILFQVFQAMPKASVSQSLHLTAKLSQLHELNCFQAEGNEFLFLCWQKGLELLSDAQLYTSM